MMGAGVYAHITQVDVAKADIHYKEDVLNDRRNLKEGRMDVSVDGWIVKCSQQQLKSCSSVE